MTTERDSPTPANGRVKPTVLRPSDARAFGWRFDRHPPEKADFR
ncbi:hypothetical protein Rhow_001194 [Rhodococcus wratislaviensis]|uniref:Uncharacterized protein n=1 Tax=Rhodococcus wratislaviensis TaxID=44752 RepID=A0A402C3E0_RHOWR|nr:hypothetical protein Rhow_001194 [Rhodococcus wratislaviensis]